MQARIKLGLTLPLLHNPEFVREAAEKFGSHSVLSLPLMLNVSQRKGKLLAGKSLLMVVRNQVRVLMPLSGQGKWLIMVQGKSC